MTKPSTTRKTVRDTIECPVCRVIQDAIIEFSSEFPHASYVHHCINCTNIITESEWNSVKETINEKRQMVQETYQTTQSDSSNQSRSPVGKDKESYAQLEGDGIKAEEGED